ncbi:hypothetical protein O1611_g866 [Lasiodiplodia mahajangana]|uniref:Uncharacterized protein n=1 Tax=Lasiodiplodia mahajangana TaxID=1108764 RepID=A0ACC2JZN1_9PEZI|nr:hypothetical protein O1611_g866 [Lasiodiplodia mahajangana]
MASSHISSLKLRRLLVFVGVVTFFLLLHTFYNQRHNSFSFKDPVTYQDKEEAPEDYCVSLQELGNIFVIIRTGFSEVHQKLQPLINTSLPCLPHYGIWSDLEETYAGQHIDNALDEIDPGLIASHSDFAYYRRLQEHGRDGFSAEELASWKQAPNTDRGRDTPGWKLDKWKFLPLAKKAYSQHPTSPWYMFIECDTFVFWESLLEWLTNFDPTKPFYIGRQMHLGDKVFAYGGAGILISNPAMRMLVTQYTSNIERYNDLTINEWAGDYILARVLSDAGIELFYGWPTLEGDMPATLDFKSTSPIGIYFWCYYTTTYHHLTPQDIYDYYEFEKTWKSNNRSLLSNGDIFRHLVFPRMKPEIPDWDNLSADIEDGDFSFDECLRKCESKPDCMQFSLSNRTCRTSKVVKLGNERLQERPSDERVSSGWAIERIEIFMGTMERSCVGRLWALP